MENEAYINSNVPFAFSDFSDYEVRYSLKEKHDKLLEILTAFDALCRENEIRYSLADGTLLGAFRHADFIPWDDDADVMMTREEYNKLRKILTPSMDICMCKATFLDRISLRDYAKDGLYIDLFINEDMPASKLVFSWKKFKTKLLRTRFSSAEAFNARHENNSKLKRFAHSAMGVFGKAAAKLIVGKKDLFDYNDRAVSIGKHKSSGIYTRFTSRMYETNRRFNKESYDAGYSDVLFRGKKLMALKNAKVFLAEMYGNFESMPPEEKRIPEHGINVLEIPSECIKWFN